MQKEENEIYRKVKLKSRENRNCDGRDVDMIKGNEERKVENICRCTDTWRGVSTTILDAFFRMVRRA
jgi:hypothetical protein